MFLEHDQQWKHLVLALLASPTNAYQAFCKYTCNYAYVYAYMKNVLRGPACNYLLCGRRTCEVFLSRGTETLFLIDVMWSPVAGRNTLKRSKTYR